MKKMSSDSFVKHCQICQDQIHIHCSYVNALIKKHTEQERKSSANTTTLNTGSMGAAKIYIQPCASLANPLPLCDIWISGQHRTAEPYLGFSSLLVLSRQPPLYVRNKIKQTNKQSTNNQEREVGGDRERKRCH